MFFFNKLRKKETCSFMPDPFSVWKCTMVRATCQGSLSESDLATSEQLNLRASQASLHFIRHAHCLRSRRTEIARRLGWGDGDLTGGVDGLRIKRRRSVPRQQPHLELERRHVWSSCWGKRQSKKRCVRALRPWYGARHNEIRSRGGRGRVGGGRIWRKPDGNHRKK